MRRTPKAVAKAAMVLPLSDSDTVLIGKHASFMQDWLNHETPGDPWWDPLNFGGDLSAVPPATLVGGWYDLFLPAQVADYQALKAAGRTSRLTVGPWTHGSPGGMGVSIRDGLEFFDEQLKAAPAKRAPVRLFVMGSKRWEDFAEWPPPAERQQWFLGRNGTLSTDVSTAGPPDSFAARQECRAQGPGAA
jgi:hypothetical protein